MSLFDRQPKATPTEDLPPLDKTAEVPVTHSDTVHGVENWQGIQNTYRGGTARLAPEQTDDVLLGRTTVDARAGQDAKKKKLGHLGITGIATGVAATAAGAIITVTSMLGGSGEETEPPRTEPSASAPANQTPDKDPGAPTQEIGVAGTTFETVNVRPSPEMIEEALQPVTVEEYPTPEAALERFGEIENVFDLSATVTDNGTSDFPETAESKQLGLDILTNMFGNEAAARDYYNHGSGGLRHIIGQKLWYINENDVIEVGKTATWHGSWVLNGVANDLDKDTYSALVNRTYQTNFHEIDEAVYQNIPNIQSVMEVPTEVTLHKEDDTWYLDSLYSQE